MKGWRMPAPAPCPRSISHLESSGRKSSADTSPPSGTTNFKASLVLMARILAERRVELTLSSLIDARRPATFRVQYRPMKRIAYTMFLLMAHAVAAQEKNPFDAKAAQRFAN